MFLRDIECEGKAKAAGEVAQLTLSGDLVHTLPSSGSSSPSPASGLRRQTHNLAHTEVCQVVLMAVPHVRRPLKHH